MKRSFSLTFSLLPQERTVSVHYPDTKTDIEVATPRGSIATEGYR